MKTPIQSMNPSEMKYHFIERASPLIDAYIDSALGVSYMKSNNSLIQQEVWNLLRELILNAKNKAPLLNLRGKNIESQIDEILTKVSAGEINLEEAKEYMSLVSAGFNLQKLPELMSKLEILEGS